MREPRTRGIHQMRGSLNKVERELNAVVDINSIPEDVDLDAIVHYFIRTGVLVYDSERGGDKPAIYKGKTYVR